MAKALLLLLIIAVLAGVAFGCYTWMDRLVRSIYDYQPPTKGSPPATTTLTAPLADQIVLVAIDGLRYDASTMMPQLNALRLQGAHAQLLAWPPSNAQTRWTSLLTGTGAELNWAPLFDYGDEWVLPMQIDHLFAAFDRARLKIGIAGSHRWQKLLNKTPLYLQFFVQDHSPAADAAVTRTAGAFLREFRPDLLLVHLQQLEEIGLRYGGASEEYRQAALRCDEHIGAIVAQVDLSHSVLIVVSTYGHLDEGGHGGTERATSTMPFVMAGARVIAGEYEPLQLTDIAPLVASLAGAPIPRSAEGIWPTQMLQLDQLELAEKWTATALQHVRVGNVYLHSIGLGPLSRSAEGDALVALSSLDVQNYASAAELGELAVRQTVREMQQGRRARIWQERTQRGLPIALALAIFSWIIVHYWDRHTPWCAIAAALALATYHVLYVRDGNSYTFSRLGAGGFAALLQPSIRYAVIAATVGAAVVTLRLLLRKERSGISVLLHAYGYGILQLYFLAVAAGLLAWWIGPVFQWYVPNLALAFILVIILMQAMLVALLSIPVPAVILLLQRFLWWILRQARAHLRPPNLSSG